MLPLSWREDLPHILSHVKAGGGTGYLLQENAE